MPPDALLRLVDHFDQNRKVFLSSDYKEEQLRAEFLNCSSLSIRHSDLASAAPVGQRVVRTSPGPFFTALGWDVDMPLTRFVPEIGEVSPLPLYLCL